jgi:hypothetical protein
VSEPFDLDKHRAEQERARSLGMDYSEIRTILLSVGADADDGVSVGQAVELVREMALRAVDRAVAEERDAVVAALRRTSNHGPMGLSLVNLDSIADAIERGEHRHQEKP